MSTVLQNAEAVWVVTTQLTDVVEKFYYIATYLSYVALLLSVLIGGIFYHRIPRNTIAIFHYFMAVLLLESLAEALALLDIDNLFLFPLYSGGELFFLGKLFVKLLGFPTRFLHGVVFASLIVTGIGYSLPENSSALIKPLIHLLVLMAAVWYLLRVLTGLRYDKRFLRVNYAIIFYFTVSLFLFFFLRQLADVELNEAYLLWGFHNLLLCVFYTVSISYFFAHRIPNK